MWNIRVSVCLKSTESAQSMPIVISIFILLSSDLEYPCWKAPREKKRERESIINPELLFPLHLTPVLNCFTPIEVSQWHGKQINRITTGHYWNTLHVIRLAETQVCARKICKVMCKVFLLKPLRLSFAVQDFHNKLRIGVGCSFRWECQMCASKDGSMTAN